MTAGRRLFGHDRPRWMHRRGPRRMMWLLAGVAAVAALVMLWRWASPLYWPAPGVVCDRVGNFCADPWGMSESLSSQYLGEKAAAHVRILRDQGGNLAVWQMSTGLTCDADRHQCWINPGRRYPDPVATQRLFHAGLPTP